MGGQRGPCFWTLTLWKRVWPTPEAPVRYTGGGAAGLADLVRARAPEPAESQALTAATHGVRP